MYLYGCGVEKDVAKAASSFDLAANHNVPEAFKCQGDAYYISLDSKGGITVQDRLKVAAFYSTAVEKGVTEAFYYLGRLQHCIPGLASTAQNCFQAGAAKGDADCMAELASFDSCTKAAEMGSILGLHRIGGAYRTGTRGVEQNVSKAVDYYRRVAELGSSFAWGQLGAVHEAGGETRNHSEAQAYYENAQKQGLPKMDNRKNYKEYNNEYGSDFSQVHGYYRTEAAKGDHWALYNLGMLHLEGRGVEKDFAEGINFLAQAAKSGNKEAQYRLRNLAHPDLNSYSSDKASGNATLFSHRELYPL